MDDAKKTKKKKLKKVTLIVITVFAALCALLLILYGVLSYLKGGDDYALPADQFFPADYSEDITKDQQYQAKVRSVYYLEFGTGELITEENLGSLPDSAKFFYDYFNCVISGNYTDYKGFFTQDYLKRNKIPDKFTKQKIYDIEVNLYDRQNIEQDGKSIIVDTFIVKYKIMRNNGTFRNDVGSNTIVPLVFQLYKQNNNVYINNISHINTK